MNGGTLELMDATSARALTVNYGQIISFGTVSSWSGPIALPTVPLQGATDPFLYVTSSNLFTITGPISGPTNCSLVFFGGEVVLSGSASDSFGTIGTGCDLLRLSKSGGAAIGARHLTIGAGKEVRWFGDNQLAGASLTLGSSEFSSEAFANLNGFSDEIASLTSSGGSIQTGAGQLTLNGSLTQFGTPYYVEPLSIRGNLRLSAGIHEFEVPDTHCCTNDVVVEAAVHGPGSLFKTGEGNLRLTASNDYTGLTLINGGVVEIRNQGGLGTRDSGTVVNDGGTLWMNFGAGTINDQIILSGAGHESTNGALRVSGNIEIKSLFPSIFSAMELTTNATIRVDAGQLTVTGELRGTGPLTKVGDGTLTFSGSQDNTYSGDTIIEAGLLNLTKPAGVTAVPSHLIIGGGGGFLGTSATARQFNSFQILGSVMVDRGGLWDLNGFAEGFTPALLEGRPPLTLSGGGDVQTGTGIVYLPVGGDVVVNPNGVIGASSLISGNLGLDPGPHHFIVNSGVPIIGLEIVELDFAASMTETSTAADLVKEGPGTLRLSNSNSFSGAVTVNAGRLRVSHALALGSVAAGTLVNSNASLALEGGIEVADESLTLDTTNAAALTSLGPVTNVWSGPVSLQRTAGIYVSDPQGGLTHSGVGLLGSSLNISGPGGFTKSGPGALFISGLLGGNSYTGPTTITEGLLEATRRPGASLSSNIVVTGPNSVLRTGRPGNLFNSALKVLPTGASVTVEDSALWTMNATNSETLSRLQGDGKLETGAGGTLTISNEVSCTFSGQVTGSGALDKRGPATFQVTSPYSYVYTGAATVFDGTYKVDGDFRSNSVTVKPAAILRGGGLLGDVTVEPGGVVKVDRTWAGLSGGVLAMNSVNFQSSGGVLSLDFFGPGLTGGNDFLSVNNPVTLGNANLSAGFLYAPHEGDVVTLINKVGAGDISGMISGFPEGGLQMIGSIPVVASYVGGNGNDMTLTVTNLPLGGGEADIVTGNGGSALVSDDCSMLSLVVTNRSASTINDLHGTLHSLTEGVVVTIAESDFPDLGPGERGTNTASFQIRT